MTTSGWVNLALCNWLILALSLNVAKFRNVSLKKLRRKAWKLFCELFEEATRPTPQHWGLMIVSSSFLVAYGLTQDFATEWARDLNEDADGYVYRAVQL